MTNVDCCWYLLLLPLVNSAQFAWTDYQEKNCSFRKRSDELFLLVSHQLSSVSIVSHWFKDQLCHEWCSGCFLSILLLIHSKLSYCWNSQWEKPVFALGSFNLILSLHFSRLCLEIHSFIIYFHLALVILHHCCIFNKVALIGFHSILMRSADDIHLQLVVIVQFDVFSTNSDKWTQQL